MLIVVGERKFKPIFDAMIDFFLKIKILKEHGQTKYYAKSIFHRDFNRVICMDYFNIYNLSNYKF